MSDRDHNSYGLRSWRHPECLSIAYCTVRLVYVRWQRERERDAHVQIYSPICQNAGIERASREASLSRTIEKSASCVHLITESTIYSARVQ